MRSFQEFFVFILLIMLTCVTNVHASSIWIKPLPFKTLKNHPKEMAIFELDHSPLDNKQPLLLVHGLAGENRPYFRWEKVIQKFQLNPEMVKSYKIYLLRYNSKTSLTESVNQFQDILDRFSKTTHNQPITVIALSMGGNLIYESMLDAKTEAKIKVLVTMGTPFHGTPLFCPDWMQYGIYKSDMFFFSKIDLAIAYHLFFHKNPTLTHEIRWDNCDKAIPDIGSFKSWLPFGPKGNLTIPNTDNKYLHNINSLGYGKDKLITYAGYMLNGYMLPAPIRYLKSTICLPYSFVAVYVPAFFAREKAALKLINKTISEIQSTKQCQKLNNTKFVYHLNDGITPIASAIFIPESAMLQYPLAKESDIPNMNKVTDVKVARVFRNIDHLTFITGQSLISPTNLLTDELHPKLGKQSIFDWMMMDLLHSSNETQLAKTPIPYKVISPKTDL